MIRICDKCLFQDGPERSVVDETVSENNGTAEEVGYNIFVLTYVVILLHCKPSCITHMKCMYSVCRKQAVLEFKIIIILASLITNGHITQQN